MAETVTIPLDKPLTGHKGPIRQVVVRAPTYDEYLIHGDPYIWVPLPSGGGKAFASENMDVVREYARILIVEPADPLLLEQAGFELARKVKEAIMGFFLPAAAEAAGSQN